MSWLDFANHFLSNQRQHAQSWINGTFSRNCFRWETWLWVFQPFPFLFLFSVGRKSHRRKRFWLVVKEGTASCVASHGFLSFFLACDYLVRYLDIVCSKDLYVYFLLFSSDLWLAISLFFLLLSKHDCNLIVKRYSFLGDPSVPSSEGKGKNSYPRSRFMANELRFWFKRLVEGRTWCMSGIFVRWAIQG